MAESQELASKLKAALSLQNQFSQAHPSQSLLEDVPTEVLPDDYRQWILFRSDRDHFYVAFSDDPENLEPNEEGYFPNAHLMKISVVNGPRRTGRTIKNWIDTLREIREPKEE